MTIPDQTGKTVSTVVAPLDAPQPREAISSERIVLFSRLGAEPLSTHVVPLAGIALAIIVIYWWGIWYRVLGPELPLFYGVAHGKTFSQVLFEYINFKSILWFRPTSFYLPYWIGEHFLSWHNLPGWKIFQVLVLIPACWSIYFLTQLLFPRKRLAGVLAALYLATHPGCLSVVMQSAAFDAPHIFFVTLTVMLFCSAQIAQGSRVWLLNALAVLTFVAALTSKELTIVTPVYLTCVSALVVLSTRRGLLKQILMLVPFYGLVAAYYVLRVLQMPKYESAGDYRTQFNPAIVLDNAIKFPLWVMRLFGFTADASNQTVGHVHALNWIIGLVLVAAVAGYWIPVAVRERESRWKAILLVLWVAVFLSVPIYSGRYLWHVDLAACAYAILTGVALSYWITRIPVGRARMAATGLAIAMFIAVGIASSQDNFKRGIFNVAFRVGVRLLQQVPVPKEQMTGNAIIYIEDRMALSPWTYGGEALFQWAYLNPGLKQKTVPAWKDVPFETKQAFLKEPQAYFFRYDDDFNWFDDTEKFRAVSLQAMSDRIGGQLESGNCQSASDFVRWLRENKITIPRMESLELGVTRCGVK